MGLISLDKNDVVAAAAKACAEPRDEFQAACATSNNNNLDFFVRFVNHADH